GGAAARRLELGVRVPRREHGRIGERRREAPHYVADLRGAAQIETGAVVVGGLVVAVRRIIVVLLDAPAFGPADVVGAGADRHRGNAGLGEREVVGAIEVAGL